MAIKIRLPDFATVCDLCKGHGYYKHDYCDAPSFNGPCSICKGRMFLYQSGEAIPVTVFHQIVNSSGLELEQMGEFWMPKGHTYPAHTKRCFEKIPPLFEVLS